MMDGCRMDAFAVCTIALSAQVWEMAQQITKQQGHGLDEMLSQRPGVGGDLAAAAPPPRTMPRTSSQTSNISGISAEVLRTGRSGHCESPQWLPVPPCLSVPCIFSMPP